MNAGHLLDDFGVLSRTVLLDRDMTNARAIVASGDDVTCPTRMYVDRPVDEDDYDTNRDTPWTQAIGT